MLVLGSEVLNETSRQKQTATSISSRPSMNLQHGVPSGLSVLLMGMTGMPSTFAHTIFIVTLFFGQISGTEVGGVSSPGIGGSIFGLGGENAGIGGSVFGLGGDNSGIGGAVFGLGGDNPEIGGAVFGIGGGKGKGGSCPLTWMLKKKIMLQHRKAGARHFLLHNIVYTQTDLEL
ncbi:hypothetical protein POM88_019860 [Heracleum sosnowskyi]|uniref:Uncharacterized protein n=1 Tax=Heracleum sosnowskyi TaxID=360622 RepID=A0AAD8MMJ7_9APIA|nr:hypothetical protein POM88_019860 [Heracleum sosnowskyi]